MMKSDIHILILSSWYPTKENPFLGNFVKRQAELLAKKYTVTVLNTYKLNSSTEINVATNSEGSFIEINVTYPAKKFFLQRRKQQRAAFLLGVQSIQKIDLIIGHVLLPKGHLFVEAKKTFGCPLIYVEHGSYFRKEKRNKWSVFDKYILRKVRRHVDSIVAVSSFLKKDLEDDFPDQEIEVIGNHIDTKLFNYTIKNRNEKMEFLHVSTMDKNTKFPKGILLACELLKKETSNFHLTIISDEDLSVWRKLADSLRLSENISFIGPLQWEELVPYYQKANAFLLFSDYESFSIVLAEAWATGTPTISTPVGIAHEMNNELGIQIGVRESDDMAKAMLTIINNDVQFEGEKIREYAMQYSSDNILNSWTNLIEKHIG